MKRRVLCAVLACMIPNVGDALVIDDFEAGAISRGTRGSLTQSMLPTDHVLGGTREINLGRAPSYSLELTDGDDGLEFAREFMPTMLAEFLYRIPLGADLAPSGEDRFLIRADYLLPDVFNRRLAVAVRDGNGGLSNAVIDPFEPGVIEIPFASLSHPTGVAADLSAAVVVFVQFAASLRDTGVPGAPGLLISDIRTVPEPQAALVVTLTFLSFLVLRQPRHR